MISKQVFLFVVFVTFLANFCESGLHTKFRNYDVPFTRSNFIYPKDQKDSLTFFIVGGAQAIPHYFPYVVAIEVNRFENYSFFCAGTLITTRWVLTAAHCLDRTNYTTLHFGRHNLSAPEPSQINMDSNNFVIHEEWNETLLLNDIGLIYLPEEIRLSDQVKTVEVASGNHSFSGVTAYSMGWGLTNLGKQSDVLRYLDVKILDTDVCKENYRLYKNVLQPTHICTSGEGLVGTCKGDSGGPLIYQNKQIGISSFGYTSCSSEKPSVYTRLSSYIDWLKEKTNITFNNTDDNTNSSSRSLQQMFITKVDVIGMLFLGYLVTSLIFFYY